MIWVEWVGEGRSGTTVLSGAIGSRIDCRIAEEQGYVGKWHREDWSREQIMAHLLQSGKGKARAAQGWKNLQRYDKLLVVGDKHPWGAVNAYAKRGAPSTIINEYSKHIDMPVKVIVTVRNPYDNIASWASGNKYKRLFPDENTRISQMIRRYRRFYNNALEIIKSVDYYVIYHEELIANPSVEIQNLSNWLGLPPNKEWRRECAKRIWSKPRRRKNEVNWSKENNKKVRHILRTNPLMEPYRRLELCGEKSG